MKEIIKLTFEQYTDLYNELEYEDDNGNFIHFNSITENYIETKRHTELWEKIVQRKKDNKYFKIIYENSVKDTMGWDECNQYKNHLATEVFPKEKTIVIYE